MERVWLKYGLVSGGIMVGLFILSHLFVDINDTSNYGKSELIGYASMLLSLLAIYFGIRHQKNLNETLTLKEGLKTGIFITLVASVLFGIYSYILMEFIATEFLQNYYDYYVNMIKTSGDTAESIKEQLDEMKEMEGFLFSTFLQSLLMFFTVFLMGSVISIISSLILKTQVKHS